VGGRVEGSRVEGSKRCLLPRDAVIHELFGHPRTLIASKGCCIRCMRLAGEPCLAASLWEVMMGDGDTGVE